MITPPSICIIDDSEMTTKIYGYLIRRFLTEPRVTTFNHPWDVNLTEFAKCNLIVIDEIMDDITGTEFIEQVITNLFKDRCHEFPNVIFASSLDPGDLHERIKAKKLDSMIPSYRVIQKPLTPDVLKQAVMSICPKLKTCMRTDIEIPNSELPWLVSIKKAVDEILGIDDAKPTKHCMISL